MISGDIKGDNNRHMWFDFNASLGKGDNGYHTFMASHRKCMVNILISSKYCVGYLNEIVLKHFSRSSSYTNEPNFKIVCNSIHELFNVFEDSA